MASEYDFYLEKVNEYHIRVYADESELRHAYEFFKYQTPNFQPSRFSKWDGVVRLLELRTGLLPAGLLQIMLAFCKDQRYKVKIDERITKDAVNDVSKEDLKEWIESLQLTAPGENFYQDATDFFRIDPYYYQLDAVYLAVRYNKMTILAATGAGKSLIAYILARYYEMLPNEDNRKHLIVVPSAKLVNQLAADFEDYSILNGWKAKDNIHKIVDGGIKTSNKPIFISTWQALQDEDESYFEQFDKITVDECHKAAADKLTRIAKLCNKCHQRVGMTATLKDMEMHQLQVQANFGPIKRVVSTKELQELGQACDTMINVMNLEYSLEDKLFAKKKFGVNYQHEIDWLIRHPYRNKVIKSMALSMKGNSLFLFNRNEAHLEVIYNELKELRPNVHMINGDVGLDDRAQIEEIIENYHAPVVLHFNDKKIVLDVDFDVPMSDGGHKKAVDVTPEDDVCDDWVRNKL